MKRFGFDKILGIALLALFTAGTARAQSADSPVSISAALIKLFGNVTAFTAKADVQVVASNRVEILRTPMDFSVVNGRMRMDVDMTLMKGLHVSPQAIAGLKESGLDRVVSIIRLDEKTLLLMFPRARSYVSMPLSAVDAEAAAKDLQVLKTLVAKETLDGHPCAKNKVTVRNAKGAVLLEAVTWNAADLSEFPLQIAVQSRDNTTILHFKQVQWTRAPETQFQPTTGFKRFDSPEALMLAATKPAPKPPPPKR